MTEKRKQEIKNYRSRWWKEHREWANEYQRRWRKINPEKAKAQDRKRRKKYADRIRIYNRQYCRQRRAWARKRCKEWRKNNPEQVMNNALRYRWKKRLHGTRLSWGLTKKLFASQNGLCRICNADLNETGIHKDHITPISKGGRHEDSNIQLLCPTCNIRKGARIL